MDERREMNGEDFKALLELQDRVQKSYKRVSIVACTTNRPKFSSSPRPAHISFGFCSYDFTGKESHE
jgi:hypothetical protein